MDYIEFTLNLLPETDPEVVMAILSEAGFESFDDNDGPLRGYIPETLFDPARVLPVLDEMVEKGWILYRYETVQSQNWNAVWESNYNPVMIDGQCRVRAPFHPPDKEFRYDLLIEPKMSFGTAHHETTELMISMLLQEEATLKGQRVLDMGCGTGVLAILADKMGAGACVAIDNDDWAFENALDNKEKNKSASVTILRGDAGNIPEPAYDLIMANINRNVLLRDLSGYSRHLRTPGTLLISGFYEEDLPPLLQVATTMGFQLQKTRVKNRWMCAKFVR
ncbi:MAG TPA: 50S ribosomal protein L11 methyltransferase [Bacteroidales bacterium]|nr:50S ribosomal protein L11 methyltransferase [Bacteroidales bacterium]HPT10365.1 50S ribosomal protein L11 methyltransferase [Bacteroidales bacterium]